jgi:hypothetical protein
MYDLPANGIVLSTRRPYTSPLTREATNPIHPTMMIEKMEGNRASIPQQKKSKKE